MGSKQRCSFCKIMLPSLTREVRVPSDFVKKNKVILSVKQVKLRTSNGETWKVKLEIKDNGEYYFTKGWDKFAENLGLRIMEFIAFKYAGDFVFDVTMYGITGCENDISGSSDSEFDEDEYEDYDLMNNKWGEDHMEEESGNISKGKSALYFERLMRPCHKKRMTLGKRFAIAANLVDKGTVKLEYLPSGYNQDVRLFRREKMLRMELAKGWNRFREENLVYGKTYSFKFNPINNVIEIEKL